MHTPYQFIYRQLTLLNGYYIDTLNLTLYSVTLGDFALLIEDSLILVSYIFTRQLGSAGVATPSVTASFVNANFYCDKPKYVTMDSNVALYP